MKLSVQPQVLLLLLSFAFACSINKEQQADAVSSDSTQTANDGTTPDTSQETEEEETQRLMKERHMEDSVVYSELGVYDGTYEIQTESEGVDATLYLQYNGDRTFHYSWTFTVTADEVYCSAKREGVIAMDRTQHGIDASGDCIVHFNFNGYSADGGYIVELQFEDQAKCEGMEGDCTFSGTYTKK